MNYFHNLTDNEDNLSNNNNYFSDYKEYNDFFPSKDNYIDFSFLPLPENKLIEIEINQKNINTFNNQQKINYNDDNKNKEIDKKERKIKFILSNKNMEKNNNSNNVTNYLYRKDAYYKHFKSIFAKYIKNKSNRLKNICFPNFNKNNFSALSSKYTGNPKEKDNYKFLSFTIKELLSYGKDEKNKNRQYNNQLIIKYIEENKTMAKDKKVYMELIKFLNENVEITLINFYKDNCQFEMINSDSKCQFYDTYFKSQTGISLLEKNGFIKILKNQY